MLRLIDHEKIFGRAMNGLEQAQLTLRAEMMDGEAAPGGVCGFGTLHQSFDEIDLVEFDRERRVSWPRAQARARKDRYVIMVDLGAGEGLLHLAGVVASDVDKGEGFDEPSQRGVEKVAGLLRGQRVIVTSFW